MKPKLYTMDASGTKVNDLSSSLRVTYFQEKTIGVCCHYYRQGTYDLVSITVELSPEDALNLASLLTNEVANHLPERE